MPPDVKTNGQTPQAPPAPQAPAAPPPAAPQALVPVDHSEEMVRVGFDTLAGYKALQRIAAAFAASSLVPDTYQGKPANCIIACEMAMRMGASPLMVMQNLYLVHGRPAWSSQFLIASFNNCGRFTPIRYRWTGEKGKDTWGCIAWTKEKATGEVIEGPEVTVAMAKGEGWWSKKSKSGTETSKWQTMPQLMLSYRSATFLVRTTAPDLAMGLKTADEQEDIGLAPADFGELDPKGVDGLKAILGAAGKTVDVSPQVVPPHDPVTGELKDEPAPAANEGPTPEQEREADEIAAQMAETGA